MSDEEDNHNAFYFKIFEIKMHYDYLETFTFYQIIR